MKPQRGTTLGVEDVEAVYAAVMLYAHDLEQHRSWLRTNEGIPLPGTEMVIAEMDKEIVRFRALQLRLYEECYAATGVPVVPAPDTVEALKAALPVLQDYASSNPMHFYRGAWQDPRGVHAAVRLVTAALGGALPDGAKR